MTTAPLQTTARPDGPASAGATLEAMRLGVVPREDLDAFTVGRRAEMDLVDGDLARVDERGGAVRAFLGDYGAGKTHLLELIAHRALADNFVVGRVVLDPRETPPSHPKRVYRELIRSLSYPDRPSGAGRSLAPLFERALASDEVRRDFFVDSRRRARSKLDEGAHLYLTPALRYFDALAGGDGAALDEASRDEGMTLLFDWLEGHPTVSTGDIDDGLRELVGRRGRVYSMMDFRPWSRIYGYLLSGLSTLARRAGYAGLVVLIDEAEFYSLLSAENREFARFLFKALAFASIGAEADLLPFDRDALDRGGYGILQDLPPQYDPDAGLYTVFAMTPHAGGIEALRAALPADALAEIAPLGHPDYRELVARVFDYYRALRPRADLGERLEAAVAKIACGLAERAYLEDPRQAMKFVVEILDLATFRPDAIADVVDDLRRMHP
ncbi:MAG: BREX system ATP-binding domain-containing protein [Persicimonas sp.]